jgi:hypothetical protein
MDPHFHEQAAEFQQIVVDPGKEYGGTHEFSYRSGLN